MSDAPAKQLDPTESIRTITSTVFKEQYMTLREHQDTDKHYIGESLPVPADSMVRSSGGTLTAGSLPFPARADHVHDSAMVWGYVNSGTMTVAPGSVYINNLQYAGWGRNMLASAQVVAFPRPGLYFVQAILIVNRQGGGNFANEVNVIFTYNNGTSNKVVYRGSTFDIPANFVLNITDYVVAQNAPSVNDNLQVAVQQNDTVSWDVAVQQLIVSRVGSLNSY
jgi:hypothetical protein